MSDAETSPQSTVSALSPRQERRLIEYLDNRFLAITRAYKKRTVPQSSTSTAPDTPLNIPTLTSYLAATREVLSLILQIPPIDPSTSLRTTFLLRFTGETMSCICGYPPVAEDIPELLEWLDDLDNAWLTVLQARVWDPSLRAGVDLIIPAEEFSKPVHSTPLNQTERTRLRSLLVGGTSSLEEWLAGIVDEEGEGEQQALDDLFSRTLEELGALSGVTMDPDGMRDTC
ncbi:hypothetical protein PLICRDRAFT_698472 [Plicaturopsis crispa FD-325 SS-3]|nr:hypothetical protein PLICRDRAFT_698472 [Plicaturopsis crispa FD-325 SS-3]